jgi:multicomponent K+:H+ antiporter subunit F
MDTIIYIGFAGLTTAILLALLRMARGPTVVDRILAFDAVTVCVVGLIVLLSIQWDTSLYLELILVVSLLGFISGVAFVFYLERTMEVDAREPADEDVLAEVSSSRRNP